MHRFWTIPEIITQVLEYLSEADWRTMTQVCQALWAPAVRLIWEDVPQFSKLLRLFPEEHQVWYRSLQFGHEEFVALTGCLWNTEWQRLHLYSPFVTTVRIEMDDQIGKTLRRLHAYSKGRLLLPNLRVADVQIEFPGWCAPLPEAEWTQICELILSPNLERMDCRQSGWLRHAADHMALPFFDCLQRMDHLERLCWSGGTISNVAETSVCRFLSSNSSLVSVHLDASNVPHAALFSASHIPTLAVASLSKFQDAEYDTFPQALFVSMTDLECGGTAAGLETALRILKAPKLNRLCISMSDQEKEGKNPFDILNDLERFPSLTDLRLQDFQPSLAHLQAILSLKGLKTLHIKPPVPKFNWTYRHWPAQLIRLLAESFPQLEVLVLGSGYSLTDDIAVSLPDLECFAQFCPNLTHLAMSVDATGIATFSRPLIPHPTLEVVDLGGSEEDGYAKEIAGIIFRLWPYLRKGLMTREAMGGSSAYQWERIWKEVVRLQNI
ncbi:hypothetical protein FS837_002839 [Tulasnella sp. UAMH 9824]|nr:hypothetical protein FS837_002839 [Tulasnella sp. UAMH 9824]